MDDLITTADAADLLGKSVRTVNWLAQENRLVPAVKLPGPRGARLYRRADVEAYIATQEAKAS